VTPDELVGELERAQIAYELIPHRQTMTAGEEAAALEVPREQVAKTLVLATAGGHMRAVLPASERLDLRKARELLGDGKTTRLATEEELAGAYPMFELGVVPPFAGPAGDRTIVDRRLAAQAPVVIDAGSHTGSVRMGRGDS
jgi:prolyl-tRNA editing enzyme YbaK/EbsC (Cys-tRNA(Pro) deacylase)